LLPFHNFLKSLSTLFSVIISFPIGLVLSFFCLYLSIPLLIQTCLSPNSVSPFLILTVYLSMCPFLLFQPIVLCFLCSLSLFFLLFLSLILSESSTLKTFYSNSLGATSNNKTNGAAAERENRELQRIVKKSFRTVHYINGLHQDDVPFHSLFYFSQIKKSFPK